ncbi:ABC transporter permease [Candidatus Palauibacter sp.]|jgi:putative ABC transport system permease protein|uniref:ABC transporter permease n=1 Tax=Candidatus Palauibacter sp. TaxID=3101350 RepID=UPI003B028F3A
MRFWEGIRLSLQQVWAQKLKSFFALLGIIIGITFLIAVITIVEGMNRYVREDFAGSIFGVNTFTVVRRPTMQTGRIDEAERRRWRSNPELSMRDVEVVRSAVPEARYLAYYAQTGVSSVRYGQFERRNVRLVGGSPDYGTVQGWTVEEGRGLTPIDDRQALSVAVIGSQIAERLFPTTSPIGKRIRAGGHGFRVIGVLEEQGGFVGNIRDASVLIPFETFQRTLSRRRLEVDGITVKVNRAEELDPAIGEVEGAMRSERRLRPSQPNNFGIDTSSGLLQAWETINRVLMTALPGLVGISLVVGGIVIMNIMLLSVTDRTREIGLRKSLGARRRDILVQFLTEASMLSIVGAALGIGAGFGLALLIERVSPLPAAVSMPAMIISLVLGLGVGITSGLYPAYRAARLDPIEALRFE